MPTLEGMARDPASDDPAGEEARFGVEEDGSGEHWLATGVAESEGLSGRPPPLLLRLMRHLGEGKRLFVRKQDFA